MERGERGSSEEHLTVTQFKVGQEQKRLAKLTAKLERQEQALRHNDEKIKRQKTVALTQAEIEGMGRKTLLGKVEMTQQEAAELKNLAGYGLSADAEISSLKQKLEAAKREAQIWKQRYEKLAEQTKDFMAALKRAPERVRDFIQRVLRAEPEQVKRDSREYPHRC